MQGGFFRANWDDSYDCSRLLLPEVFAELPFRGNPVAVVASRCDLFVTDEFNTQAQWAMLQEASRRLQENGRHCGGSLIVLSDGQTWTRFHAVDEKVRRAERSLINIILAGAYAMQKKQLDQMFERSRQDIYVGAFMTLEDRDGNIASIATITQSVDALIPQADRMVFVSMGADGKPKGEGAIDVNWDDGVAALGGLLEPYADAVYPPRFRVLGFPDETTLLRLRAKDVFRS